jgi:hypothetical protein
MIQKTFSDRTAFNTYLSSTDDCMQALMDYYPSNAEGKVTYAPDTKQQQPAWKNWGLMEAESKQWSLFRKQNNELPLPKKPNKKSCNNNWIKTKLIFWLIIRSRTSCNAWCVADKLPICSAK